MVLMTRPRRRLMKAHTPETTTFNGVRHRQAARQHRSSSRGFPERASDARTSRRGEKHESESKK